jgi:Ca-activated chloride channel homolog
MTNLSGGLIQGCQHLLQQNTEAYVNRLLLLSDGHANRGITEYDQLMKVIREYQNKGLYISTLGVSNDFNEELMEGMAEYGKGNYYFIQEVEHIPEIFSKELEGLLSVVAQNVIFTLHPKSGVRVKKVFGYLPEHNQDSIRFSLGDM